MRAASASCRRPRWSFADAIIQADTGRTTSKTSVQASASTAESSPADGRKVGVSGVFNAPSPAGLPGLTCPVPRQINSCYCNCGRSPAVGVAAASSDSPAGRSPAPRHPAPDAQRCRYWRRRCAANAPCAVRARCHPAVRQSLSQFPKMRIKQGQRLPPQPGSPSMRATAV